MGLTRKRHSGSARACGREGNGTVAPAPYLELRRRHARTRGLAPCGAVAVAAVALALALWLPGAGAPMPDGEPETLAEVVDTEAPKGQVTGTYDDVALTAVEGTESSEAFSALLDAVDALEADGISVGICLEDLGTGDGVAYRAGELFYPASAVKVAAATCAMEADGGTLVPYGTFEAALVWSDNNSYYRILNAYGQDEVAAWMQAHGVEREIGFDGGSYPELTPSELASLWKETARFVESGGEGADTLAELLGRSERSVMGGLLRSDDVRVLSKPGWYPADGTGCSATNDAGVVTGADGPYVYVVMTTAGEDFEALEPLVSALDGLHGEMARAREAL